MNANATCTPVEPACRAARWIGATAILAAAVICSPAYATPDSTGPAGSPSALNTALQSAFECHSVGSNIDQALQAREIPLDGETHATLAPPITVLGFEVSDVTVFRDSGEDVYTSYIRGHGAEITSALKKATWQGAQGFTVTPLPGDVTRLACLIAPTGVDDAAESDD